MLKFFRQYNSQIMVVVVALLMLVFLGGPALQAMFSPQPGDQVVCRAFGETITLQEQLLTTRDTRILSALGFNWSAPWGFDFVLKPLSELDYLLLVREAHSFDLQPDVARARALLGGRDLTALRLNLKVSQDEIEQAVANHLLVLDAWSAARDSIQPSTLEINHAVTRQFEKLGANVVQLSAEPLVDPEEPISAERLQKLFDQHRAAVPGGGLDFGYLLPDRVRVQAIRIAADDVQLADSQKPTTRQAQRYWTDHRDEFLKPIDPTQEEQPEDADPFYGTFEEAAGDVVLKLEADRRLEIAREMAQVVRARLAQPWYDRPIGDDGFPAVPEGDDALQRYQTLVDEMREVLAAPDAVSVIETELISREGLDSGAGIASARDDTHGLQGVLPFVSRVFAVQGLITASRDQPADSNRTLAVFQTAPLPLIDTENNLYVYRVIEVRESQPPATLAEVQDRVMADARLLSAFERLGEQARALEASVADDGLRAAWDAFKDSLPAPEVGSYFEADPFAQWTGSSTPAVWGGSAPVRSDALVNGAYGLYAQGVGSRGLFEDREAARYYLIEVGELQHLTPTEFKNRSQQVSRTMLLQRRNELKTEWFDKDRLRQRVGHEAPRS